MTKIYQVSGADIGRMMARGAKKGFTLLGRDPGTISEGEMDLLIARDNMVTKRNIVARQKGIGALKTQKFQNTIDVLDDALHGLTTSDPEQYMGLIEEDILAGEFSMEHELAGIGCPETIGKIRKAKGVARRAKRAKKMRTEQLSGIAGKKKSAPAKTKTGGFLKKAAQKVAPALKKVQTKVKATTQKVVAKAKVVAKKAGEVAKKVAKGALKVATAPQRLLVKAVLEVMLPQAAPFFLYLFINDPKIIAKLPVKVTRKRDKAVKIKNFIVNVIGMKDAHFMGIIRNGIMKKMGASPETILATLLKSVSGIGNIGFAVATVAVAAKAAPVVIQIIQKLIAAFKKNKGDVEEPGEDDAPSADDFGDISVKEVLEMASDIKKQNDLPEPNEERTEKPAAQQSSRDDSASNDGGGSDNGGSSQIRTKSAASVKAGEGKGGGASEIESEDAEPGDTLTTASGKNPGTAETVSTDANGEIQKEPFGTGGRKGWNSLG